MYEPHLSNLLTVFIKTIFKLDKVSVFSFLDTLGEQALYILVTYSTESKSKVTGKNFFLLEDKVNQYLHSIEEYRFPYIFIRTSVGIKSLIRVLNLTYDN